MARPSLKINALSSWLSLAVSVAIGFLLTPFVVHNLGKTGYGIWVLVGSFVGYYGLLNLGVTSATTRYIARYTAQKDSDALNSVASTALVMFTGTGILAILLSFALAPVLADFCSVADERREAFVKLVRIIGVTTGIGFPSSVLGSLVTARERYVARNTVVIVRELLRAGATVLFVTLGWGLLGVGLASLLATAVGVASNIILAKVYANDVQLRLTHANFNTLRMLLLYGGVMTVIVVADIMRHNLDSLVIAKWIGVSSVGIYGIAATIMRYSSRLVVTGMGVLTPRFAALEGENDQKQLQRLLVKALTISSFLSFGACLAAIVFGKQFILWWVGGDFSEAVPVLWILSPGVACALAQNPAIVFMYALNKHHFYAVATIVEAVANLTLSIILVRRYGIVGVALGTLVPMLIVKILVMPVYVSRVAGVNLRRYVESLLPSAVAAIAIGLGAYSLGIVTRGTTTLHVMLLSGMCTAALYVGTWSLIMRVHRPPSRHLDGYSAKMGRCGQITPNVIARIAFCRRCSEIGYDSRAEHIGFASRYLPVRIP